MTTKTVTWYQCSDSEMALVQIDGETVMLGNLWDFHPGCHDITEWGDFSDPSELVGNIKAKLKSQGYRVVVKTPLCHWSEDSQDFLVGSRPASAVPATEATPLSPEKVKLTRTLKRLLKKLDKAYSDVSSARESLESNWELWGLPEEVTDAFHRFNDSGDGYYRFYAALKKHTDVDHEG